MADRILAFSDIHGRTTEAKAALQKSDYNPDKDLLVYCGDAIDRGHESRAAVKWLQGLQKQGAVILKGNHEAMLLDWLSNPYMAPYYLHPNNGGPQTLQSYRCRGGQLTEELRQDAKWMQSLPVYHIHENYFFVHAGLDPAKPLFAQKPDDMLWIYKEWVFGQRPHPFPYKVVYGHAITLRWVPEYLRLTGRGEEAEEWSKQALSGGPLTFHEDDRICVDTGAATGLPGTVVVYDITNRVEYRA